MLDFTLHTWDVVDALGLKDPILVGHSMGGMIAAEMAAVRPNDVSRLALIAPAGLWLDDHPIADIFATLPYEMPALLFHDAEAGKARLTAGLATRRPEIPAGLSGDQRAPARHGRAASCFPIPERGLVRAALPREGEDDARLGRQRQGWCRRSTRTSSRRLIKGAQLVSIPEAGHMVLLEKPRETVAAIQRLV